MAKQPMDDKAKLILANAKKLFSDPDQPQAGMRELAKELKLSASSLYNYFPSKTAIIEAVIDEAWNWFMNGVRNDFAKERDPNQRFRLISGLFLNELIADKELIALIMQHPECIGDMEAKLDFLAEVIDEINPGLKYSRPGIAMFFLGCLATTHFAATKGSNLEVCDKDVLAVMRDFIRPGV